MQTSYIAYFRSRLMHVALRLGLMDASIVQRGDGLNVCLTMEINIFIGE